MDAHPGPPSRTRRDPSAALVPLEPQCGPPSRRPRPGWYPPGQAGRATSRVFLGNSLALVVGVPLGTLIGQVLGWRTAVAVFALAGTLSLGALLVVLPEMPPLPGDLAAGTGQRLRTAVNTIRDRAITPLCAVTTVAVVGQFAAYTYIAPLVRRSGLDGAGLSALLLGYGAAGGLSTLLVGRVVDRARY